MVLNALDEVLFWGEIGLFKGVMTDLIKTYYPTDPNGFYKEKNAFFREHIPDKAAFLERLEYYSSEGAPVWVSGRNGLNDDIDHDTLIKAIDVSATVQNGKSKAGKALKICQVNPEFWDDYGRNILFAQENHVLELTIGAGLGTTAIMKIMSATDYYMGVDIDFICAKNADAIAKYFDVKGLGMATSLWQLPLENNMFTSVCCNAGLEECREIETVLSEGYRVLTHKGRLVLHTLHSDKIAWFSYFMEYGFTPKETLNWLRKVRLFASEKQVVELLTGYGMKCVEIKKHDALGYILVFEKQ